MQDGGLGSGARPDGAGLEPDAGHGLDEALQRLTDDQRAADAAEARRREHSLRQQSAESGTFAGALADLAERREPVVISTVSGRNLRGTIASLGEDHLLILGPAGDRTLVPSAAVTVVRPAPGRRATVGDRDLRGIRTLAAVLADLAAEHPPVVANLVGGDVASGRLWSAGQDMICVRGDDGSAAFVAISALSDLLLR